MLGTTLGDGVGEFGETGRAHQMDVLDLDIARRARRMFQQKINARTVAVLHLAANRGISRKLRDRARHDRFGGERVGMRGVDTDELGAAAKIDLDELPAMRKLALQVR